VFDVVVEVWGFVVDEEFFEYDVFYCYGECCVGVGCGG